MVDKTGVLKNGMYIGFKTEYLNIIENDRYLFRCNLKEDNYTYPFGAFLNKIFLIMCNGEKIDIIEEGKSRQNEIVSKTIKINKSVLKKMEEAGVYINDKKKSPPRKLAKYYFYFVEKYLRMSLSEREKTFYHKLIDEFNDAAKLKRVILVRRNNGKKKSYLLPYRIITAEENGHQYLTGFAVQKNDTGGYNYKGLINIPIYSVLPFNETFFFEKVDEIKPEKDLNFTKNSCQSYLMAVDNMKDRLNDDGVLYISAFTSKVKVRLTDTGLEYLYSRIQYRPRNFKHDKNDNHIIYFNGTWLQTFLYFFKFGAEAEIITPDDYRNRFREQYQSALDNYANIK